jgi:hypothetical protein
LSYLFLCRLGQGVGHERSLHDIDLDVDRELHLYETIKSAYRYRFHFVSTRQKLYLYYHLSKEPLTIKDKSQMRNVRIYFSNIQEKKENTFMMIKTIYFVLLQLFIFPKKFLIRFLSINVSTSKWFFSVVILVSI